MTELPRRVVALMTVACGVGVATVYFPQAVVPLIATSLGLSAAAASGVVTVVQLGYAAGIFLLVPLGDRLPRRPLVAAMFAVSAVGLLLCGAATSLTVLLGLGLLVGVSTVAAQVLIPMAADLAAPEHRARAVSTLQAGLLAGVLLARAFGGVVGQLAGWRAPYLVAGAAAAVLSVLLALALPTAPVGTRERYRSLLGSVVRLLADQPDLRRSGLYQALVFGAFSAAWTSLALLLTGPTYGFGTGAVGVIALVGAASVVLVPVAGRWIDRHGPERLSLACFATVAAAGVVLLLGSAGGPVGVAGLVVGMLVLDVGMQTSQVANQARIFALVPGARSRLNGAYMTCAFVGGSLGSLVGVRVFASAGWWAVCTLVVAAALAAAARHLGRRRSHPQSHPSNVVAHHVVGGLLSPLPSRAAERPGSTTPQQPPSDEGVGASARDDGVS